MGKLFKASKRERQQAVSLIPHFQANFDMGLSRNDNFDKILDYFDSIPKSQAISEMKEVLNEFKSIFSSPIRIGRKKILINKTLKDAMTMKKEQIEGLKSVIRYWDDEIEKARRIPNLSTRDREDKERIIITAQDKIKR